jgi:hypothetical protein
MTSSYAQPASKAGKTDTRGNGERVLAWPSSAASAHAPHPVATLIGCANSKLGRYANVKQGLAPDPTRHVEAEQGDVLKAKDDLEKVPHRPVIETTRAEAPFT